MKGKISKNVRWQQQRWRSGKAEKSENVSQLCDLWQSSVRYGVKPSTYACYLTLIEKHIRPELGCLPVVSLNNRLLMEFIEKKQGEGLSDGTLRLILFLMKSIVHGGASKGIWPAEELCYRLPKKTQEQKEILSQEDFGKMFRHLLNSKRRFDLGVLLLLCTGIRVGELCGVKWGDIDLRRGILRVRRTVARIRRIDEKGQREDRLGAGEDGELRGTVLQIGPPKTGTSLRDIPLPQFLIQKLGERETAGEAFLLTGSSRFMEPRGVQRRFKNLLRKCGITPVNIHSLRHSFASKWIEKGFDSKALSEILGHSSVKITMDIYVHSSMNQKKNYMDHVLENF